MKKLVRRFALLFLLPVALISTLGIAPALASDGVQGAAGVTRNIERGDGLRRLSITQSGYNGTGNYPFRAVTRILPQKYICSPTCQWVPVTVQALTLYNGELQHDDDGDNVPTYIAAYYGNHWGSDTCRWSGSGTPGSVGCSVPNTNGVYFFSAERDYNLQRLERSVLWEVHVIFDQGDLHKWNMATIFGSAQVSRNWWSS